jgi:thiamine biosynthesis lipoprotein
MSEVVERFACFGSHCEVRVLGLDRRAAERARRTLRAWHARFTRFDAESELSRLNADPAFDVAASAPMARFVQAACNAARTTGGLVDPTLLGPLERLGYAGDLGRPLPQALALRLAPPRRPAAPAPDARWKDVSVDLARRIVSRPPGLRIDGGGIVKGLAADVIGAQLRAADAFVVDCAGDLRVGGGARRARPVQVHSPFDGSLLHTFELADGGIATSGIGRRSWLDERGRPAHHLLDPSTGRAAFTGIVQATAVAPTAVEAEVRAKAALLAGPRRARAWLPDGGVLVLDSGRHVVHSGTSQGLPSPLPGHEPMLTT